MNEQTTRLIEQLAQKLGTTAEYLWAVLLKQAPISAATDLFYLLMSIIGGIILIKIHKSLCKKKGEYDTSIYEEHDGWLVPVMIISVIIWAVLFIASISSIGGIVNGFFNPEYWALNKVLSLC